MILSATIRFFSQATAKNKNTACQSRESVDSGRKPRAKRAKNINAGIFNFTGRPIPVFAEAAKFFSEKTPKKKRSIFRHAFSPLSIPCLLALFCACAKQDPVLPGTRSPVFKNPEIEISNEPIGDLGTPLAPGPCNYEMRDNQIWRGNIRIFAGIPTESEVMADKKPTCHGKYIYAGLSTGELIKVADNGRLEWTADIFAENSPTGGAPFLDILAPPVYDAGYIYAGGLGGAFCKVRDQDGKKAWCLPLAVQSIVATTDKYKVIKTMDGKRYAVSNEGKTIEL